MTLPSRSDLPERVHAASFLEDKEEFRRLYELWASLAVGDRFPQWSALDILRLKPWMGSLFILDFKGDDPETGVFTLVGTTLVDRFNQNITGQRVYEIDFGPNTGIVRDAYCRAFALQSAIYSENTFIREDTGDLGYQRLLLPFFHRRSDNVADRLLGYIRFRTASDRSNWVDRVVTMASRVEVVLT